MELDSNSNSTPDLNGIFDHWTCLPLTCLYQVENCWFEVLPEEESSQVRTSRPSDISQNFNVKFVSVGLLEEVEQHSLKYTGVCVCVCVFVCIYMYIRMTHTQYLNVHVCVYVCVYK